MGGFNAGEIFGALKLDDAEFRKALQENANLASVLKVNLEGIQGTMAGLASAVTKAGLSFEPLDKFMKSLRFSGVNAAQGLEQVTKALGDIQNRANALDKLDVSRVKLDSEAQSRGSSLYMSSLYGIEHQFQDSQKETGAGDQTQVARQIEQAWAARDRSVTAHQAKAEAAAKASAQKMASEEVAVEKTKLSQMEAMWKAEEGSQAAAQKAMERNVDQRANKEIQANQKATDAALREQVRLADMQYAAQQKAARNAEHEEHQRYFEYRQMTAASFGMGALGLGVTAVSAVPVAGLGIAAKAYADLDEQVTKSTAIMQGLSDFQRKDMVDSARLLSKETGKSVDELAGAYYYLKSAGLSVGESITALPTMMRFSIAANSDLQKSTELLTSAMSAMGMESNDLVRISDVLVKADIIAKGKAIEFAEALAGKGGGALRLVNKDLEEGVAILATFAKVGIVGKEAQEALNQTLRDFQKVALKDKVIEINGEMFKFRNIVYDSQGNMRKFSDITGDLEKRLKGMSDEQVRATFIHLGFQDRSVKATQAILGMSEATANYEKELRHSEGTTREVSENQLMTFNRNLGMLKAQMNDVAITLGEPVVKSLQSFISFLDPAIKGVQRLSQEFEKLPDAVKKGAVGAVGVSALGGMGIGSALSAGAGAIQTGAMAKFLMGPELFGDTISKMPILSKYLIGPEAAAATAELLGSVTLGIGAMTSALTGAVLGWIELQDSLRNAGLEMTELGNRMERLQNAGLKPGDAAAKYQAYKIAQDRINEMGITGRENTSGMSNEEFQGYSAKLAELKQAADVMFKFKGDYDRYRKDVIGISDKGKVQDINAALQESLKKNASAYGIHMDEKPDVEFPKEMTRQQAFQKMGVHDYEEELKGLEEAYRKYKDELTDSQMERVLQNMDRLKEIVNGGVDASGNKFGPYDPKYASEAEKANWDMLKRYDDEVKDYLQLGEKAHNANLQWAKSEDEKASAMLRASKAMQDAAGKQVAIDGSGGKPKGVPSSSWSVRGNLDPSLATRLSPDVYGAVYQQFSVNEMMKDIGRVSQGTLDYNAGHMKEVYEQIRDIAGASAYDTKVAWVAMVDAIAQAHHVLPEKVDRDYRKIKESVENVISASDRLWKQHLASTSRAISSIFGNLATNAIGMLIDGTGTQTDKLAPLVSTLRNGFEGLGKEGYTDAGAALQTIINQIKGAGSAADANAIAIKHFGDQGGEMAKEIRDGTISAGDLQDAMNRATKSIQDFAADSQTQASRWHKLWTDAIKGVGKAFAEDLGKTLNDHLHIIQTIEKALGGILGIGNKVGTGIIDAAPNLGNITGPVDTNLVLDTLGLNTAATTTNTAATTGQTASQTANTTVVTADTAATAADATASGVNTAATVGNSTTTSANTGALLETNGTMSGLIAAVTANTAAVRGLGGLGGIGGGGEEGGGGGGIGSGAGGLMGTLGAVGSIGTMVSSVVGNFQMAGMNKTLDLIEHETRYTHLILQAMMDLHNIHIPKLESIWGYLWTVQNAHLQHISEQMDLGGGRGGNVTIGTVVIQEANDAEALVRDLKAMKAV